MKLSETGLSEPKGEIRGTVVAAICAGNWQQGPESPDPIYRSYRSWVTQKLDRVQKLWEVAHGSGSQEVYCDAVFLQQE